MGLAGRLLRRRPRRPSRVGTPAVRGLTGTAPGGGPIEVVLEDRRTVLLFLTSSCYGCRPLWEGLSARAPGAGTEKGTPPDPALILVTPSPSTESARDVAALAPAGRDVLMSSEAWHAFGVTAAPWLVVVSGGCIEAEGAAPDSWEQVAALVGAGPD